MIQTGSRLRRFLASVWPARICFALYPAVTFVLVDFLSSSSPILRLSPAYLALNLAFYYLAALVVYLITGRAKLSAGITLVFFWAAGMANCYVVRFRGRPIVPGDLLTLGTAANVASNYSLRPSTTQIVVSLVTALLVLPLILLPRQKGRARLRLRSALPVGAACAAFLWVFFGTSLLSDWGVKPAWWGTDSEGFLLHFNFCLSYARVSPPDGYSLDAVSEITQRVEEESVTVSGSGGGTITPENVIVIMNESFSDLSVLGGLETNQDCLPFLHSLTENTIKGTAYSSVFGGTTANSEYEFLTGNTTAFLSPGMVPYQLYVGSGAQSLVSQMNTLGYRSVALHPYYSTSWNRVQVYDNFGFSDVLFYDSFVGSQWIRAFISDQSDYENLIRLCEEKEPGEKLFLFNVTMQNHGAYTQEWTNLPREVYLTGDMEDQYPTVDQYLSLMYQSDLALEYLIDYFSQVDEPTMILLFGDHQPQVSSEFYTELLGTDLDAATAQRKYAVPFLIWANYDIEEQDGVVLSLNYLSSLLVETAGLPSTGYQQFLSGLRESVPVVNAVGYASADGQWTFSSDELSQEDQAALLDYQYLQYNEMFASSSDRADGFFSLDGGS
jgi:hypothetical protein